MKRWLAVLMIFSIYHAVAQVSEKYSSEYVNFYRAEELFQKQQFAAARIEFRNFLNEWQKPNDPHYSKALYYEGISALELFNNGQLHIDGKYFERDINNKCSQFTEV